MDVGSCQLQRQSPSTCTSKYVLLDVGGPTKKWTPGCYWLLIDVPSLNLMQKQRMVRRISFKMLNFQSFVNFKTPPHHHFSFPLTWVFPAWLSHVDHWRYHSPTPGRPTVAQHASKLGAGLSAASFGMRSIPSSDSHFWGILRLNSFKV